MDINDNKIDTKTFVNLMVSNRRRIQAFILMLVPNINDAEDIFQETILEMWKKFDTFQVGTDFVAWAVTIAKYKVLTFRKKTLSSKMQFSNEIIELLESTAGPKVDKLHEHLEVLKKCMGRLREKDVLLLKLRYENDMTYKAISSRTGKSPVVIHRMMSAIHASLATCIRRTLRLEDIA